MLWYVCCMILQLTVNPSWGGPTWPLKLTAFPALGSSRGARFCSLLASELDLPMAGMMLNAGLRFPRSKLFKNSDMKFRWKQKKADFLWDTTRGLSPEDFSWSKHLKHGKFRDLKKQNTNFKKHKLSRRSQETQNIPKISRNNKSLTTTFQTSPLDQAQQFFDPLANHCHTRGLATVPMVADGSQEWLPQASPKPIVYGLHWFTLVCHSFWIPKTSFFTHT